MRKKDKNKEGGPALDEEVELDLPEEEPEDRDGRRASLLAWALFLVIPCYAADQLSKWLICRKVEVGTGFNVIPGFLDIIHVRNTGAAFGMLQGIPEPFRTYFFLGITIVAFIAILVVFLKIRERSRLLLAVFSLIIAGALGNLTDRFLFGEVVDFLSLYVGRFRWPTFNLADTYISLGMVGLLVHIFLTPSKEKE
ncbi:MAG TPA: signal peptidase II [Deltaproteobacteria bacterium]|nr:signal peptidase II [Deltaproteobacteria bacterium]HQI01434.1 signal peptidase II [Deltaproteobacteria bacterium]